MTPGGRLLLALVAGGTAPLSAQVRILPDPEPLRTPQWAAGAAQIFQRRAAGRPVAAQFDSLGLTPMAAVGDSVTIYFFDDGATLTRSRVALVTARQRFLPPVAWRAACDAYAHPGWLYTLDGPATASFAVVVPGTAGLPERRDPPPLAKDAAQRAFVAFADTAWQRYRTLVAPKTERAYAFLWYSFFTDSLDAGYHTRRPVGVRGPNGIHYAAFSFWLHDDAPNGTPPNTTGTWLLDGWGRVVGRWPGNVDVYGTIDGDHDGIDEVLTSRGLIRWNGTAWDFPEIYSEEPCLARRSMTPPPGVSPE